MRDASCPSLRCPAGPVLHPAHHGSPACLRSNLSGMCPVRTTSRACAKRYTANPVEKRRIRDMQPSAPMRPPLQEGHRGNAAGVWFISTSNKGDLCNENQMVCSFSALAFVGSGIFRNRHSARRAPGVTRLRPGPRRMGCSSGRVPRGPASGLSRWHRRRPQGLRQSPPSGRE